MQQAVSLSLPSSTFETMAGICLESESKNAGGMHYNSMMSVLLFAVVCIECLKVCLRMSMQPTVKYDKCGNHLLSVTYDCLLYSSDDIPIADIFSTD